MTDVWLGVISALFIVLVTAYAAMLRNIWQRYIWKLESKAYAQKDHVTVENARNWTALTEADRQWFQANLWNGKKVLDEPLIDCKHPNTVSERAIYDDANYVVCLDCGHDWLDA